MPNREKVRGFAKYIYLFTKIITYCRALVNCSAVHHIKYYIVPIHSTQFEDIKESIYLKKVSCKICRAKMKLCQKVSKAVLMILVSQAENLIRIHLCISLAVKRHVFEESSIHISKRFVM